MNSLVVFSTKRSAIIGNYSPIHGRMKFLTGKIIESLFLNTEVHESFKEISERIKNNENIKKEYFKILTEFNSVIGSNLGTLHKSKHISQILEDKIRKEGEKIVDALGASSLILRVTYPLLDLFDIPLRWLEYLRTADEEVFQKFVSYRRWFNFEIFGLRVPQDLFKFHRNMISFIYQDFEPITLSFNVMKIATSIYKWGLMFSDFQKDFEEDNKNMKIFLINMNPKWINFMRNHINSPYDEIKKDLQKNFIKYAPKIDFGVMFFPALIPYHPIYISDVFQIISEDIILELIKKAQEYLGKHITNLFIDKSGIQMWLSRYRNLMEEMLYKISYPPDFDIDEDNNEEIKQKIVKYVHKKIIEMTEFILESLRKLKEYIKKEKDALNFSIQVSYDLVPSLIEQFFNILYKDSKHYKDWKIEYMNLSDLGFDALAQSFVIGKKEGKIDISSLKKVLSLPIIHERLIVTPFFPMIFTGNIFSYHVMGYQFFKEPMITPTRTDTSFLILPTREGIYESTIIHEYLWRNTYLFKLFLDSLK